MKYTEIEDTSERLNIRAILVDDLKHQRDYFITVSTEIRKLLLFLNAGSAVCADDIHGSIGGHTLYNSGVVWTRLLCRGIIFLSASYAFGYHMLQFILRRTGSDLNLTWVGSIDIEEFERRRATFPKWITRCGMLTTSFSYVSWACWALGAFVAIKYLHPG